VFTPVLAKHSKNFSIIDSLAIGVDRIHEASPLRHQVETWRSTQITDDQPLVIYRAFIESELDVPSAVLTQATLSRRRNPCAKPPTEFQSETNYS